MELKELRILLERLTSLEGENEWIEFKMNNMNPVDVGKWISALSNGACLVKQRFGYLVYGVDDDTKEVKGTTRFLKNIKKGTEELEHWLIQRLRPRVDVKFYDFEVAGKKVSIVQVPAAVSQPVRFQSNAFVRIGSITRDLIEFPEKEKKIWRNEPTETFEKKICKRGVGVAELKKLISFATYFDLLGLPEPSKMANAFDRLVRENLLVRNGNKFDITNLCALLFAKNLNEFELLARKMVRVITYRGNNRIETEREYTEEKGYALMFSELLALLDSLLPKNEMIGRALRKEVPIYPPIALRELIANALIHQDLTIRGSGPMIEIFENRIEVSNPGKPLIDILRFIDHNPRSRNEELAYLMRRLNICEERGSGIDKVVGACEVFQLPGPQFIVGESYLRVKLFSPRILTKMEKVDKIRACYQHACLKYVTGEKMTNSTLRTRFGIDGRNYPMASRIISDTIDANLIKDADPDSRSKKHAKYIPFWG